jgi:glycosyltransferase involved in cell wall biosynthesis
VQVDNITPHEKHLTDRMLNRYFIGGTDGFVYMSQQVKDDLDTFTTSIPALFSPHPLFTIFGERVARDEACRHLDLNPDTAYSLFFGIVRDYKGLDILLDAWKIIKERGEGMGRKLIVAGEFYYNKDSYLTQIAANGLADDVILHDRFIRDEDVKYYFSAADILIQPYKSATQSGVTQIAYNFGVPMIVTRVGGLAEIVTDGVSGYITDVAPEAIADAFSRFYADHNADHNADTLRAGVVSEAARFSWDAMADRIEETYRLTLHR